MRAKVLSQMLQAEVAADAWWDSLSPKQKKLYIKAHPRSKYAKQGVRSKAQRSKKVDNFDLDNAHIPAQYHLKQSRKFKDYFDGKGAAIAALHHLAAGHFLAAHAGRYGGSTPHSGSNHFRLGIKYAAAAKRKEKVE